MMLDLLNKNGTEPKITTADKRAAIEAELRENSARSDREIGRICDVDGKTVASVRKSMGDEAAEISAEDSPPPTGTEKRHMLFEGVKEFGRKFPDPLDPRSAEEVVDDAVRDGKVSLQPGSGGQYEPDFDWSAEQPALTEQLETAIYFNREGSLVIRQRCWPDDDHVVIISRSNRESFLDKLCEILGYGPVR